MEAYREAINLQPRNFFAHNNLGVLYDKKGLHDAAIREFEDCPRDRAGERDGVEES